MENKKIAFFHFPRTGGSFMGYYMREFFNDSVLGIGHQRYIDVKDQVGDTFSVCFIRNPYDWYISNYFYYSREDAKTEGGVLKGCDAGLWGKDFKRRFPNFESHLRWGFDNLPNFSISAVFLDMCSENGQVMISRIGKFEFMSIHFANMLKEAGIPLPPIGLDKYYNLHNDQKYTNRSYHKPYRYYYSNSMIRLVRNFDKEFLKKYNYNF